MKGMLATLAFASVLSGQALTTFLPGSSASDSLRNADVALIADLAGGSAIDTVNRVHWQATLRPIRVLKGDLGPGTELHLAWDYEPLADTKGPQTNPRIEPFRALWLLKRTGDAYIPLRLAATEFSTGNPTTASFFLPLPDAQPSGDLAYPVDAGLDVKLASEFAAALEALAASEGDKLSPQREFSPSGAVITRRLSVAQRQFSAIVRHLRLLKDEAGQPIWRRFAASTFPNLRVLGLAGLMRSGSVEALLALDRDFTSLGATLESNDLGQAMSQLEQQVRKASRTGLDSQALDAVGRIALNEETAPGVFDFAAPNILSSSRNPRGLPYIVVMLDNPNAIGRRSAKTAFCNALRRSPAQPSPLDAVWKPEYAAHCPSALPDTETDEADIRFWKGWWDSHEEEVAQAAGGPLPRPGAPARYRTATRGRLVETAQDIEGRFSVLLFLFVGPHPEGRPAPAGALPGSRTFTPVDDEKLGNILRDVAAQLETQRASERELINQYRVQGKTLPNDKTREFSSERTAILRSGLQRVQKELSPEGWQEVEKQLNGGKSYRSESRP